MLYATYWSLSWEPVILQKLGTGHPLAGIPGSPAAFYHLLMDVAGEPRTIDPILPVQDFSQEIQAQGLVTDCDFISSLTL